MFKTTKKSVDDKLRSLSFFGVASTVLLFVAPSCGGSGDDPNNDRIVAPSVEKTADEKTGSPRPKDALLDLGADTAKVVLLGTGTPVPDANDSGPSTAVIAKSRAYLVDFGAGVVRRAQEAYMAGIAALDVRFLNIAFSTHLHSDHTIGYPDLIFTPATVGRRTPLTVFGPPGLKKMTDNILAAYEEDLAVRARSRGNRDMSGYSVDAREIEPGEIYGDREVRVTAFPVQHGSWPFAFGYRFDADGRSIVISGDTRPSENVVRACDGCDVLVHEVYCKLGFMHGGGPDWQRYHAGYHTSSEELAALATQARPKLLVLYHKLYFGCTEEQLLSEVKAGYSGDVVVGHDLAVY